MGAFVIGLAGTILVTGTAPYVVQGTGALGIILISGVFEAGAYGANPQLGSVLGVLTGIAYSGFLLALRQGGRGVIGPGGPLFDATLSSAFCCMVIGLVLGDLDFTPSLAAQGWLILLALSSQVLGPGRAVRSVNWAIASSQVSSLSSLRKACFQNSLRS